MVQLENKRYHIKSIRIKYNQMSKYTVWTKKN